MDHQHEVSLVFQFAYPPFLLISNAFSKHTSDSSTTTTTTTTNSFSGEPTAPFFALSAYAFRTQVLEQSDGYTILCTSSQKNTRHERTEDVQQQEKDQQRQQDKEPHEEAAADGGAGKDEAGNPSTQGKKGREDEDEDEDGKEKEEEEEEVHSQKKNNFLVWEIVNQ